jgi:transcriptional regulator with XRE-family HTH domain
MDEILDRIVSLMPKNKNDKIVHGAKKELADALDLDSQQTVSDWLGGRSKSYMGMLHEIAAFYNVSVTWLKTGQTEDDVVQKLNANVLSKQDLIEQKKQQFPNTLTDKEKTVLSYFNILNDKGQELALSQILALTYVPDYQQDTASSAVS